MDNRDIRPEWVPSGYKETAKMSIQKFDKSAGLNTCKAILFGVAVGDALGGSCAEAAPKLLKKDGFIQKGWLKKRYKIIRKNPNTKPVQF